MDQGTVVAIIIIVIIIKIIWVAFAYTRREKRREKIREKIKMERLKRGAQSAIEGADYGVNVADTIKEIAGRNGDQNLDHISVDIYDDKYWLIFCCLCE
ncbi:hypothetical protein COLO4_17428 [Corchorus olitorius]|uniref:Uncharacterized protein n=1 Tax=Corchorus olitorius TaxID=93759 RepID=A0A1R3JCU6_9ROSI|nr:hypothetical protein COLO4_17428 [Corchorus olitorius]